MVKLGLCSVTFRDFSVEKVISIAKEAGLEGIEWGGDVHVPPETEKAKKVANLTEQAGLAIVSYGSYYRLGHGEANEFKSVLETAIHLKAPSIRVWAGKRGSEEASDSYRKEIVEDARRIADAAGEHNISIHLEYHGNTLTDTAQSTVDLLNEINHSNVFSYWQPAVSVAVEDRLDSIEKINAWISHVHVFHWRGTKRIPFEQGKTEWKQYLKKLGSQTGTRYLLMEFVKDDDPVQFLKDVEALREVVTFCTLCRK